MNTILFWAAGRGSDTHGARTGRGALHYSYDAAHNVTIVEGDTNGNRVPDFGIELSGNKTLSVSDFTAGSGGHAPTLAAGVDVLLDSPTSSVSILPHTPDWLLIS